MFSFDSGFWPCIHSAQYYVVEQFDGAGERSEDLRVAGRDSLQRNVNRELAPGNSRAAERIDGLFRADF